MVGIHLPCSTSASLEVDGVVTATEESEGVMARLVCSIYLSPCMLHDLGTDVSMCIGGLMSARMFVDSAEVTCRPSPEGCPIMVCSTFDFGEGSGSCNGPFLWRLLVC